MVKSGNGEVIKANGIDVQSCMGQAGDHADIEFPKQVQAYFTATGQGSCQLNWDGEGGKGRGQHEEPKRYHQFNANLLSRQLI